MEKPGRKSAADLSVVTILPGNRPPAPAHLNDEQRGRWNEITASKPADWFDSGSLPLLETYVTTLDIIRALKVQIDATQQDWLTTDDGVRRYKALTTMHGEQVRVATTLATKMRLSQQSRYDTQKAATANRRAGGDGPKPWERKPAGN